MTETHPSPRRAATRDRLIDAAVAAFADKGVLAASVEEICERAGFTRGAFYSNFDSKDDLCVAVLTRKGEEVAAAATEAIALVPVAPVAWETIDQVIRHAIDVFQAGHAVDPQWLMARSELRLYALRNPSIRAALTRAERQLDDLLAGAIMDALGRQGATLAIPVDRLLLLLDGYYEALNVEEILDGTGESPARSDDLADLFRVLIIVPDNR